MKNKRRNVATLRFVQFFGIIGGLTGIGHGIFEVLQGNTLPDDIATRIGALTIIPNYLITGILTILAGILVIYWLLYRIEEPEGIMGFLIITICLFLVGGGVAPIIGLFMVCLVSTQIRNELIWWKQINTPKSIENFAKVWKILSVLGSIQLLGGIGIWLFFTPPGQVYKINIVQYICWMLLLLGTIFIIGSVFAGFSWDVKQRS